MIFASRFALTGSSRAARIMAIGVSSRTADPIRGHCGSCGASSAGFGEPTIAKIAKRPHTGSSITRRSHSAGNRSFVSCMSISCGMLRSSGRISFRWRGNSHAAFEVHSPNPTPCVREPLSPVSGPNLTLKTRGAAHYYNDFRNHSDFRRVLPKGEKEPPGGQVVLQLCGPPGSVYHAER